MLKNRHWDKAFYQKLFSLMTPIAFQNFMLAAVSAGDAAMLGFVSQDGMAAVSLAAQIQFMENLFLSPLVCGVTIGEGSVIGAGSVVTRDIPPYTLAAGNPCRVIRKLTDSDKEYYFRDLRADAAGW